MLVCTYFLYEVSDQGNRCTTEKVFIIDRILKNDSQPSLWTFHFQPSETFQHKATRISNQFPTRNHLLDPREEKINSLREQIIEVRREMQELRRAAEEQSRDRELRLKVLEPTAIPELLMTLPHTIPDLQSGGNLVSNYCWQEKQPCPQKIPKTYCSLGWICQTLAKGIWHNLPILCLFGTALRILICYK